MPFGRSCATALFVLLTTSSAMAETSRLSMAEVTSYSSNVAEFTVVALNPEAGDAVLGPRTHVVFRVDNVIWGTFQESETYEVYLPEGTVMEPGTDETPLGSYYEDVPRPVPGYRYVGIWRADGWIVTPFTGGLSGLFRLLEIEGNEVLVDDHGYCVTKIDDSGISFGPRVGQSTRYWGPLLPNGERHSWRTSFPADRGAVPEELDPDDEGAAEYVSEDRFRLPESLAYVDECLSYAEFTDELESHFGGVGQRAYNPVTSMSNPRYGPTPAAVTSESDNSAVNLCLMEDDLPRICGSL